MFNELLELLVITGEIFFT